jgi:quercetin dioxygenase-like cupin family protein
MGTGRTAETSQKAEAGKNLKLPASIVILFSMKPETSLNVATTCLSSEWPWSGSLDALVAAPQHHRKIFENDRVRVLEVCIPRGETVPVHTHRWPAILYLQSWSDHVRRDEMGKLIFDSRHEVTPRAVPSVVWCEPLTPHSVENVGETDLRVLSIELKDTVGL